jgi:hypothetical protein
MAGDEIAMAASKISWYFMIFVSEYVKDETRMALLVGAAGPGHE